MGEEKGANTQLVHQAHFIAANRTRRFLAALLATQNSSITPETSTPSGLVIIRKLVGRPTGVVHTREELLERARRYGATIKNKQIQLPKDRIASGIGIGERTLRRYINEYHIITEAELLEAIFGRSSFQSGRSSSPNAYIWPDGLFDNRGIQQEGTSEWPESGLTLVRRRLTG